MYTYESIPTNEPLDFRDKCCLAILNSPMMKQISLMTEPQEHVACRIFSMIDELEAERNKRRERDQKERDRKEAAEICANLSAAADLQRSRQKATPDS